MAVTKARRYLICYDITEPSRLASVHRYLARRAIHVQYSVFLAHMNALQMEKLMQGLESLIKATEDDLRCYPLPSHLDVTTLGRQSGLDDGFMLLVGEEDLSGIRPAA